MSLHWNPREQLALARFAGKWMLLATPLALLVGTASAGFLWAMDWATRTQRGHGWLLYLLPLAGAGVAALYHFTGRSAEGGNNLVVEQIHAPGGGVPARMAPLIFFATVVTHLFGGSAGREGTAVQMGGSIAGLVSRVLRLDRDDTRVLLMAGVAAGFGAVFGTPLAGAIFALEMLAIGTLSYGALLPCLIASILADMTCRAWNAHHTVFQAVTARADVSVPPIEPVLALKVAAASIAFGLVALLFSETTHAAHHYVQKLVPLGILRPVVGGALVIALVHLVGSRDFLGLGVSSDDRGAVTILSAFAPDGAHAWSWFWKMVFTLATIGFGFKGGEVTPLFFIGATLGNVLAWLLNAPTELFAALGFVAVFAGAANTPLACMVMGVELFGAARLPYFALACLIAFLVSGHSGIYLSQRIATPKTPLETPAATPDTTLGEHRKKNPPLHERWFKR